MMDAGGGLIMLLVALLFLTLTILVIIALIKYLRNPGHSIDKAHNKTMLLDNSINILNERLAKGEITAEEYAAIKAELKK